MESKLAIRRDKGGRECWVETDLLDLLFGLQDELEELYRAINHETDEDVMWEAVDVANKAMMIADKVGLYDYYKRNSGLV